MPNKICLLGDCKVGKTSLIRYFNGEDFNDIYEPSLTCNFINKKVTYKNIEIEIPIYDTIGDEKFRMLNQMFYKDSAIIIFVYDIANKNSFENIKNFWYNEIKNYIETESLMVILGNKEDLYEDQEVEEEEAKDYAKSIDENLNLYQQEQVLIMMIF